MMSSVCRELENLHYLDSWNKHCGGSWWEFGSRTITLTDSVILSFASYRLLTVSKFIGRSVGTSLLVKSVNDFYEAWTGKRGSFRDAIGDDLYLAIDGALISYGFLKKVPKINYLGNPSHDFFTKDPISYESAFKQYSKLELGHALLGVVNTFHDKDQLIAARLSIEEMWERHLSRLNTDDN